MSSDQPSNSNPDPLDDDLDDVWDSPTTNPAPPAPPTANPIPRSSRTSTPKPGTPRTATSQSGTPKSGTPKSGTSDRFNSQISQIRSFWNQLLRQIRPVLETGLAKLRPLFQKLQAWWWATLPKIRQVLPQPLNQQSDRVLTGVAIALVLTVLWVGTGGLFRPARATQPTQPSASQATPTAKPALKSDRSAARQSSPSDEIIAPTVPVAPPAPPRLDLTPEQSLIAAIQDQVAEVTNQYANGLIQSIQANFRSSRLIVLLSDEWYSLPANRQDQLTSEMQKRALELNFNSLEMSDSHGVLLARSPVIGETMIILKRTNGEGEE
jgi:hypothetical protein